MFQQKEGEEEEEEENRTWMSYDPNYGERCGRALSFLGLERFHNHGVNTPAASPRVSRYQASVNVIAPLGGNVRVYQNNGASAALARCDPLHRFANWWRKWHPTFKKKKKKHTHVEV